MLDFATIMIFVISTLVIIIAGAFIGHGYDKKLSTVITFQIIFLVFILLFLNFFFEISCS